MIETLLLLATCECSAPAPAAAMGVPVVAAQVEVVPVRDGFLLFEDGLVRLCQWR